MRFIYLLDEQKIGNFKMGTGIAEKSHETRRDRWGGNVTKIPILTLCHKFLVACSVILKLVKIGICGLHHRPSDSFLLRGFFSAIPIPILKFPIFYSSSLCIFY